MTTAISNPSRFLDPGVVAASDLHKTGWDLSVYQRRHHEKDTYVITAMRDGRSIAVSADTLEAALAEATQQAGAIPAR